MKKLIVYDLDGTLAESKSALDAEMAGLLHDLLGVVKVAVISGGAWKQFEEQPLDKAYEIRKLRDTLGIPLSDMIVVGDALFPGGNDYPAEEAGVVSIPVKRPAETRLVVQTIIACLGPEG